MATLLCIRWRLCSLQLLQRQNVVLQRLPLSDMPTVWGFLVMRAEHFDQPPFVVLLH
jgi:hypothetical protein